jgi:hypothetical protein
MPARAILKIQVSMLIGSFHWCPSFNGCVCTKGPLHTQYQLLLRLSFEIYNEYGYKLLHLPNSSSFPVRRLSPLFFIRDFSSTHPYLLEGSATWSCTNWEQLIISCVFSHRNGGSAKHSQPPRIFAIFPTRTCAFSCMCVVSCTWSLRPCGWRRHCVRCVFASGMIPPLLAVVLLACVCVCVRALCVLCMSFSSCSISISTWLA